MDKKTNPIKHDDSTIHGRLRHARTDAGYGSAAAAATAMGLAVPTYIGHENGHRGFKRVADQYARFFRVALEWLLTGRGPMKPKRGGETKDSEPTYPPNPQAPLTGVKDSESPPYQTGAPASTEESMPADEEQLREINYWARQLSGSGRANALDKIKALVLDERERRDRAPFEKGRSAS